MTQSPEEVAVPLTEECEHDNMNYDGVRQACPDCGYEVLTNDSQMYGVSNADFL
jgi:hypothetical protein